MGHDFRGVCPTSTPPPPPLRIVGPVVSFRFAVHACVLYLSLGGCASHDTPSTSDEDLAASAARCGLTATRDRFGGLTCVLDAGYAGTVSDFGAAVAETLAAWRAARFRGIWFVGSRPPPSSNVPVVGGGPVSPAQLTQTNSCACLGVQD
jgi:hypothetical protein